jgi:hypothetical protein
MEVIDFVSTAKNKKDEWLITLEGGQINELPSIISKGPKGLLLWSHEAIVAALDFNIPMGDAVFICGKTTGANKAFGPKRLSWGGF